MPSAMLASSGLGDGSTTVEQFVRRLAEPVAPDQRERARPRMFDALVAAHAGARCEEGERVRAAFATRRGSPSVALPTLGLPSLGFGDSVAALARLIRTTEVDDLQLASCTTPSAIVVPAVLGASSAAGGTVTAARCLDAVVVGYEATYRLGLLVGGPDHLYAGGWPTFAVASSAAAVAAATVLGADAELLAQALALGGELVPASAPRGEPARLFAFGAAVAAGTEAAIAARAGSLGDPGALERAMGWIRTPTAPPDADLAGEEPAGLSGLAATSTKLWCSAGQAAGAIEATGAILDEHGLWARDVTEIVVEVPSVYAAMVDVPFVEDRIGSMCSAQYGVAMRLCEPRRLLDCVRRELTVTAAVRDVMSKVHVRAVEEVATGYPDRWPTRVRLRAGGRWFMAESGGPGREPDEEDLLTKAAGVLEQAGAGIDPAALGEAVARFEDVEGLIEALRALGHESRK